MTVYVEEKVMNAFSSSSSFSSSPSSFVLLLHHFLLEAKVKWVNVGMRRMEGWAMKVLMMPRCQQQTSPRRKPGRKIVANVAATAGNSSSVVVNCPCT